MGSLGRARPADRADASVTWYNKKSSDIILLQPLNPSIGFFQEGANAATMRNRGWEVSLNVRPLISRIRIAST